MPPAVAVLGPTAAGKTELAVALAEMLDGEVISVDSALIYRGLDIGTAKPSLAERRGIPHHLIDLRDPAEPFSTGEFRREAVRLLGEISHRGRLPILAGGTMLYFKALFEGLATLPSADPAVRQSLEREAAARGWPALHAELARIDPRAAARIHPHDSQRIQRALEVHRLTGRSISDLCSTVTTPDLPVEIVRVSVAPRERAVLHQRIERRFHAMLQQGFIDEVQALFRRGDLHADLPALRAVGYRQVWDYLEGAYGWETMTERAIIATRQFAKRQFTWLQRIPVDFRYDSETPQLAAAVRRDIEARLDR